MAAMPVLRPLHRRGRTDPDDRVELPGCPGKGLGGREPRVRPAPSSTVSSSWCNRRRRPDHLAPAKYVAPIAFQRHKLLAGAWSTTGPARPTRTRNCNESRKILGIPDLPCREPGAAPVFTGTRCPSTPSSPGRSRWPAPREIPAAAPGVKLVDADPAGSRGGGRLLAGRIRQIRRA